MVVFNISLNSATPSPPASETYHDTSTPPEPSDYYHNNNHNYNYGSNMNNYDHWVAVPGNPQPVHILDIRRTMDEARFGRCSAPNTDCHNRPVRQINGEMRRSQYCEFHHCQYVEDGRLCAIAKPPRNERFCNDHLRCQFRNEAAGLRRACDRNVRDNDPFRFRYCEELHLCRMDQCPRQRTAMDRDGRLSDYCEDHQCTDPRCTNGRVRGGPFCRDHTCSALGCFAHVERGGNPRCERHRVCAVDGCRRPCAIRAGGITAPYCEVHCCEFEQCDNRKRGGHRYCAEHNCAAQDCFKGRVAGSRFCREHDNRCSARRCDRQRAAGSIYCTVHARGGDDFARERDGDRGRGGWNWQWWGGRNGGVNDPLDTCQWHDGLRGCNRAPAGGTDYCNDHRCQYRNCRNARTAASNACNRHQCQARGCTLAVHNEGTYCEAHRCLEPGCRRQRNALGDYCDIHGRCAEPGCGRMPVGGPFCREHAIARDPQGPPDMPFDMDRRFRDERERLRRQREDRERREREGRLWDNGIGPFWEREREWLRIGDDREDWIREDDREWMRGGGFGWNVRDRSPPRMRRADDDPLAASRDENGNRNPFYAFGMRRV